MDYAALAKTGNRLLQQHGMSMKVTRAGVAVGSAYGIFVKAETKDETSSASSVLASTSQTVKGLLLSGLAKAPLVGDVLSADKGSWTVRAVDTVRPTTTTVLYKLDVL